MECVEGKGRFLDDIKNGVWATSEESFWGVPSRRYIQKADLGLPDLRDPIADLFAAQTSRGQDALLVVTKQSHAMAIVDGTTLQVAARSLPGRE